jgi:hypothetical protein
MGMMIFRIGLSRIRSAQPISMVISTGTLIQSRTRQANRKAINDIRMSLSEFRTLSPESLFVVEWWWL